MSPRIRQGLSIAFGLLLLAGGGYSIIIAIRGTLRVLGALNSSIAVAVIAAAATVFVSVLSIVLGKAYEARSVAERQNREKKIPVYEDLIKFMFRVLMGTKTGTMPTEEEMLEFMSSFNQRIMVWGADEVLAAWVTFRKFSLDEGLMKAEPMRLMFLYEDLIRAIRQDLGHKNRGLTRGDILALFVNDIGKYVGKGAS
jgi:hypothetical protein